MSANSFDAIQLARNDNVICLLRDMSAGEQPSVDGMAPVPLRQDTSLGHKVAISDIKEGAAVLKYGEVIGRATQGIAAGEHVHLHNLCGLRPAQTDTK